MSYRKPTRRDRWVTLARTSEATFPPQHRDEDVPSCDVKAIQVFYDEDGPASTASLIIEDIYDNSPVPTGIVDQWGHALYRIPWRDTVPIGYHYRPQDYDEFGDYIGDL